MLRDQQVGRAWLLEDVCIDHVNRHASLPSCQDLQQNVTDVNILLQEGSLMLANKYWKPLKP